MPKVEETNQWKLLLVEGLDAYEFFKALLRYLQISDIQVQNFGGINQLRPFLGVLINAPNFDSVQSIVIVRDAEQSSTVAFAEACYALGEANLVKPSQAGQIAASSPNTGIYLLPDLNAESGMLEDLCLQMLNAESALICVDEYFQCLQTQGVQPPKNLAKAKITAFLASRPKLRLRVAYAMNRDYWNWDHPCLDSLKDFLRGL